MKIGYARVSSIGQTLDVQIEKLRAEGCEKIFHEKQSASNLKKRVELENALRMLREGDILVVTRLDRLARSMLDLMLLIKRIDQEQAGLVVLDQNLNTQSSEGRLMFHILGSFAEFENEIRKERQFDGIEKAKKRGTKFGRRPLFTEEQGRDIVRLREEEGFSIGQLMNKYSCSDVSIYRTLKKYAHQTNAEEQD